MFYDTAKIYVKGGDGGNGIVAFRREKYVPEGGPAGGDGGNGGSIIMRADPGLRTLVDFRYQRHYKAERGEHGQGKKMHGKSGETMVVRVPVGTVVRNAETGELLVDLTEADQEVVVARGGRGGRGNARYVSSVNRVPSMAENGEPGEELWLTMELKLLADVGLVGFPNVGKSTIISMVSAAKPKIADYPFTTLVPNLGVVRVADGRSFVMADIPGLIEGAHTGAGLGHQFLRHTERTKLLVHVIDMSGSAGRDPLHDLEVINRELQAYSPELAGRRMVLAANKMDLPEAQKHLQRLQAAVGEHYEIFPVSAATGQGLETLTFRLAELLDTIEIKLEASVVAPKITRLKEDTNFNISREEGIYIVYGADVERRVAMTNFDNEAALERLQHYLRKSGLEDALRKEGVRSGDTVRIGKYVFDFYEPGEDPN